MSWLIQIFFITIPGFLFGEMGTHQSTNSCTTSNHKQVNDTITIEYQDVIIGCLKGNGQCTKCIITNEKDYQALLNDPSPHPECTSYKLPPIDFSKYILIGEVIGVAGCTQPETRKELIKIPSEKKYLLKTLVKQNGICLISFTVKIWVIIPIIEPDYKIDFSNEIITSKLILKDEK
jgi:hypothetical protein